MKIQIQWKYKYKYKRVRGWRETERVAAVAAAAANYTASVLPPGRRVTRTAIIQSYGSHQQLPG